MDFQPADDRHDRTDSHSRFIHQTKLGPGAPGHFLVISFCTECLKYIAATDNPALLAMVERIHRCDIIHGDATKEDVA